MNTQDPQIAIRIVVNAERCRSGWPIDSPQVEEHWLPLMGPSSIAFLRYVARHREDFERLSIVRLVSVATALGLGHSTTKHSPIVRTIRRLDGFRAARIEAAPAAADLALGVYSHLPPAPVRSGRTAQSLVRAEAMR